MTENTQIKQFCLSQIGDQLTTSGNMTINEVASALITLAATAGYNQAKKEEEVTQENER
ncbi:MAG: hypothetical protein PHI87_00085 [Candidatus Methanomethylophilus sp.]|nr:hypothetical protein [Methanomethylophilus sp.]